MVTTGGSRVGWVLTPPLLVLAVLVLDVLQQRARGILVMGLLDEPAHLATACLVLLAVAGRPWSARHPAFTLAALVSSMAIDVDHLPLYAGVPHWNAGGRPVTHSLLTVLVLGLAGAALRRRRPLLWGAAAGVVLHFVRDVATGPGLPLLWPLGSATTRVPHDVYVVVLVLLLVVAAARELPPRRRSSSPRP